jgi:hypothetical protein
MPGIHNDPLNKVSVLKYTLPKQEVVLAHWYTFSPRVHDGAMEPVDLGSGEVAL